MAESLFKNPGKLYSVSLMGQIFEILGTPLFVRCNVSLFPVFVGVILTFLRV